MKRIDIQSYKTRNGYTFDQLHINYEIFGPDLTVEAPSVLVCHALTGNSNVSGNTGWWNQLIGPEKLIDTNKFRVIGFDIPGNGYNDPDNILDDFQELDTYEIANIFNIGIRGLGLDQIHSVIGGSLGGMIVWEFICNFPSFAQNYITIASDFRSSDWVIAQNFIQEQIIKSSSNGLELARQLSMLFYRTPDDYKRKFNRSWNDEKNTLNVKSYLSYQGEKLKKRMHPIAYRTMTHLLSSCSIANTPEELARKLVSFTGKIHIVGIESDILFPAIECQNAFKSLKKLGIDVTYNEISSKYGHDAFLIEYEQLTEILNSVFSEINILKREIERI